MKILVTGATGFIGSHLVEALVQEGYQVRAFVRPSSQTSLLRTLGVELVQGDLTDHAAVEHAVRDCQRVYHLAARTAYVGGVKTQLDDVNVRGTVHVALAALKADVERVVYGSSAGVYGTVQPFLISEQTKPRPDSHYRSSKLLGEQLMFSFHERQRLPVVVARITATYGPRSLSWLGLFRVIAKRRFRLLGAGKNRIHLAYVSDAVHGLLKCGEIPGIEGETYLLPGREPVELHQFAALIAQGLGQTETFPRVSILPLWGFAKVAALIYDHMGIETPYAQRYELFAKNIVFDGTKARQDLEYIPIVSLRDGIQRSIVWYREHGHL